MRLTIVASGDFFSNYGGGQVYVKNLVDELINQKDILALNLSVISFSPSFHQVPSCKQYQSIPLYELNPEGDITSLLTKINPEIVHAHGEKVKVAIACKKAGIPCIVTSHHGGLVCPAGTLLNTDDKICRTPAEYKCCLKCYLRNTPTGIVWYPLLNFFSQKNFSHMGQILKKLPFIPFISPIGETGLIVSQKLKDWHDLSENATHFIAPSNAIANALELNGCIPEKISIIPHGIPIIPKLNKQSIRQSGNQVVSFYYVGRINYVKGIHILLDAFNSIKNHNAKLHIIGSAGNNSEHRYMRKLQKKYRKDTRIVWHGKMPYNKMNEVIQEYDCLVHPAIYLEVFGLNISEALAQHKYVIATRCGGPEMQIHNENEGLLVAPNDTNALKEALLNYIAHPKQSKTTVININTHIKQLYKLYTQVY